MEAQHRLQCEQQLLSCRELRRRGYLSDDLYWKCCVALAYEYMVGDDAVTAESLLLEPPQRYYQEVQPQQLRDDPLYAQCCAFLVEELRRRGYLDVNPVATMPAARA